MNKNNGKFFQVSTLQALALGFSKSVIPVEDLLKHGDTGLGTFEDVDGEMIVLDGKCYRARNDGKESIDGIEKLTIEVGDTDIGEWQNK